MNFKMWHGIVGAHGGHWTERSEGSGWSVSATPKSPVFVKRNEVKWSKKPPEFKKSEDSTLFFFSVMILV